MGMGCETGSAGLKAETLSNKGKNQNSMAYVEILTVILLTMINGLLAMSELAIASSRVPKLRAMTEKGIHGSRRALKLASDPGRFLSTVQIGITLIGIIAGAFSGATLGLRLSDWFRGLGLPESVAPFSDSCQRWRVRQEQSASTPRGSASGHARCLYVIRMLPRSVLSGNKSEHSCLMPHRLGGSAGLRH